MNYDFNRKWLTKKFEEIRSRILKAIEQLYDDQLNWRPDPSSHNVSILIKHIVGNIQERISNGILHQEVKRNRKEEFTPTAVTKEELQLMIDEHLQFVIDTVKKMTEEQFEQKQLVRGRERTNLDMLHQCAAHYSEHMGQIFYIAKLCLKEQYKSTSV
jgi:uncharacterized damage-inducible protein DinB